MSEVKEKGPAEEIMARWPGILSMTKTDYVFAPFPVAKAIFLKTPSPCDRAWYFLLQMLLTHDNSKVVDVATVLVEEVLRDKMAEAEERGYVVIPDPRTEFMKVGARMGWDLELLDIFLKGGEAWAGRVLQ